MSDDAFDMSMTIENGLMNFSLTGVRPDEVPNIFQDHVLGQLTDALIARFPEQAAEAFAGGFE